VPPRPISRAGAVRFVILFLVLTAVFLTFGRYAVNTGPMNWYLFQVARQTSFVLGVSGHSCSVENPDPYAARGDALRAETVAWRSGDEEAATALEGGVPPSSYEVWKYRAARLARDLRHEQRYLAMAEPLPRPSVMSPEEHITHIRASLDRVVASTKRGVPPQSSEVMVKGLKEIVATTEGIVAALESGSRPSGVPIEEALDQLEAEVERARAGQAAFLGERVAALTTQVQDRLGPLVMFVARESADAPRRFNFHLVPDCGALPSMSIYLAALLAFPATWRQRLVGVLIGAPLLYAVNIARLVCLAFIGAYAENTDVFEFAHQYVWQAVYILIVVGVWLLWVELIVRPGAVWSGKTTSGA